MKANNNQTINITNAVVPVKRLRDNEAEFISQYREHWPLFKSGDHVTTRWTARVDLYYLDGTTNNITITMPVMVGGTEEVYKYLESYVCELATLFLGVEYYKIKLGSIDNKGREHFSMCYNVKEIPTGKVWVNNSPFGMWMEPQKIKDGRWIIDEKRNKGGRGPYPFPYNEPHEIVKPKIY